MKQKMLLTALMLAASPMAFCFCGFYVSKADVSLKNKTSQVILVREGKKTVVTMYNDFKGDTKDFAMVVPVPVVLKKSDIHVVDQSIFQRLNDYSAPRLVEYYDANPCNANAYREEKMDMSAAVTSDAFKESRSLRKKDNDVRIEAQYIVGEYDIMILSAKESSGLKTWLDQNGYKIPKNAEEVLDPYIKNNLKFFVVKVNETEKKKLQNNFLRPLQISFRSEKFMLPIRLGMANADGDQDMIVYAFTRKGRIECTNYRNVNIPTGQNIPLFVQKDFGTFYANLFTKQWNNENQSVGFLEYAWDVSPANYYHCDPCIATAPAEQDLVQSGVWWLKNKDWSDYSDVDNDDEPDNGNKNVHFTRLHFRYNRKSFPQDLFFQVTPNTETFQARYVITHPATGDLSCAAGQQYLRELKKRRKNELRQLAMLTGTDIDTWQTIAAQDNDETVAATVQYAGLISEVKDDLAQREHAPTGLIFLGMAMLGSAAFLKMKGLI